MTTAKAIVGAVVTGLSTILTALTTGDQHITAGVILAGLIAAAVAYGGVYATSNRPTSDSGESFVGFVYIVALIAVIAACACYVFPKIVG